MNNGERSGNKRAGFTLLEVLVSLIILGASFGAVFQALSQSKRLAWRSQEVVAATRISHNLLVNATLISRALQDREIKGPVVGEDGWRFSIKVSPLSLEGQNGEEPLEVPSMVELGLCLYSDKDLKKRSFCLERWYRQ